MFLNKYVYDNLVKYLVISNYIQLSVLFNAKMEKTNVNIRYFLFQGDSDSQWRLKTRRWQCCSKSMPDVVKEEKKKSAGVV